MSEELLQDSVQHDLRAMRADEVIEAYIRHCESKYRIPDFSGAVRILMVSKGMRFMEAKRHLDAFVLDHPGSLGKYKASPAEKIWIWMFIDLALGALMFYWAWSGWSTSRGASILLVVIGLWNLLAARNNYGYIRFLAERNGAK